MKARKGFKNQAKSGAKAMVSRWRQAVAKGQAPRKQDRVVVGRSSRPRGG